MLPVFQRAVERGTGATYLLTEADAAVFRASDLEALKAHTGYPSPKFHILSRWVGQPNH